MCEEFILASSSVVRVMASVSTVPNKRAKSQMWRYFGFSGDSSGAITKRRSSFSACVLITSFRTQGILRI